MTVPSPVAGRPVAAAPRPAAKPAVRQALGKLVEIVDTDVVVWPTTRPVPRVRADGGWDLVRVDPDTPRETWAALIPPRHHHQVRRFLSRADIGIVASVDGRFAGWVWMSRVTHRDPWSGLKVWLAPDEAYSYALWVLEEFRPLGLAGPLMASMLSEAKKDPSLSRVYGWVDRRNRQSAVLLRMVCGFSQVQSLRRLHVLRRWGRQVPRSARPDAGPLSRPRRR